MKNNNIVGVLWSVAIAAAVTLYGCIPSEPGYVITNAQVLTVNQNNTIAQAVAYQNGRIKAVGSDADMQRYIDDGFSVIDLGGKTLVPGFIDAHGHFPGSAADTVYADLNSPPMGTVTTIAQLKSKLSARISGTAQGEWIGGFGYDDTLLTEQRHPTRADLDAVSTTRPIWISHSSGHLSVVNSLALSLAGIDDDTANPEGGVIQRDENGVATGVLEEHASDLVKDIMPAFTPRELITMMSRATTEYIAKGVTTAQSGLLDKAGVDGMALSSKLKFTKLRLVVFPDYAASASYNTLKYKHNTSFFKVGPVKLIADGSIQGYTGYMTQPYATPFEGDANYVGYPRTSLQDLTDQVTQLHARGIQVAIHANGDAAIDNALSAFSAAQQASPRNDARPMIIHAQMAREDQLDDMVTLGMTPSFFGLHTYYWGDRHINIFMGETRALRMSPAKSAADRGLKFSLHSDTPVVPMDPMLQMWSAVNRLAYSPTGDATGDGTDLGAAQRISPMQALRAITIDAAWQVFLNNDRGSIEVGKMADFAVLDANPIDVPATIDEINVLRTYINGVRVH